MGQLIEAFQRGGTLMEGLLISRGIFVFFVCFCLPHSCRGCVSTSTWPNLWEPESEPVTTTEPESEPVTTTEPESEPSQTGKKLENDEMCGITTGGQAECWWDCVVLSDALLAGQAIVNPECLKDCFVKMAETSRPERRQLQRVPQT